MFFAVAATGASRSPVPDSDGSLLLGDEASNRLPARPRLRESALQLGAKQGLRGPPLRAVPVARVLPASARESVAEDDRVPLPRAGGEVGPTLDPGADSRVAGHLFHGLPGEHGPAGPYAGSRGSLPFFGRDGHRA